MILERQGPGSGSLLAAAMAATHRRRDALYTANPTPAQIAQLDLASKSSLEALVTVVSAVAMALITSTVVLRLTVRRYSVGRFFLDDYLVILASVFTLVVCSVVIAATKYGLGQHVWNLDGATILDQLKVCIQLMFVANIFYAAAIAFTKLSILASYLHIFAPRGLLKTTLYATACVTVGLGVASVPATIFECIPVAGAWSLNDSAAHCYTFVNFLYASTAINVTTDLILCLVPIPLFWRLQLPRRQKIVISVLFFLGGFACIASIVRLAYLHVLYDPIDVTHDLVSSVMWTIAECTIGIVCVSLPPLRSLFAKFWPGVFGNASPAHSSTSAVFVAGKSARMSPHHPYARQSSGQSSGHVNTIGSFGGSANSNKSANALAMAPLPSGLARHGRPSRHAHHSLHSSSDCDDIDIDDDDLSSHEEGGLSPPKPAVVITAVTNVSDGPNDLEKSPQRRNGDVEMGVVPSPEQQTSVWNPRHGG
ncbi:plasma membrane protein Pth11 [Sporothrix schenckii 1099-18]|uniref:Rhodopsin domain-containing protein n=2 Tax=Sporothrix schenckii TaxID=29908 RepID=U7Q5X8_SPOS1|nr:plasma membrane protein Pth11 [Sporothrix schenckii 1099-18]ERT03248.1 hypothetical protein HMPREF1624_01554 [Sporothrix schenckii ATCC 58251]KJR84324.1 plasma membrane protein Pth11 [Sporothrix schenckii 1099-18]